MTFEVRIVDDFCQKTMQVRDLALPAQWATPGNYDRHADIGEETVRSFGNAAIADRSAALIGGPVDWDPDRFCFGTFHRHGANQRSHAYPDRTRWSAIVYLSPNAAPSAGTEFVEHRVTGLRALPDPAECCTLGYATQDMFLDCIVREYGPCPNRWDYSAFVSNVFNRCVVFDARLFHRGAGYFGSGSDRRLYQLFFFD